MQDAQTSNQANAVLVAKLVELFGRKKNITVGDFLKSDIGVEYKLSLTRGLFSEYYSKLSQK